MNSDNFKAPVSKIMTSTHRGPLHRVSACQSKALGLALDSALENTVPDGRTQKATLIKLIPRIYVLRELKGYTFKEITKLINLCGWRFKESTVRDYYSQMQPQLVSACLQALANAQERALKNNEETHPSIKNSTRT